MTPYELGFLTKMAEFRAAMTKRSSDLAAKIRAAKAQYEREARELPLPPKKPSLLDNAAEAAREFAPAVSPAAGIASRILNSGIFGMKKR